MLLRGTQRIWNPLETHNTNQVEVKLNEPIKYQPSLIYAVRKTWLDWIDECPLQNKLCKTKDGNFKLYTTDIQLKL